MTKLTTEESNKKVILKHVIPEEEKKDRRIVHLCDRDKNNWRWETLERAVKPQAKATCVVKKYEGRI